ncbi:hypothetical protein ATANTOWER_004276 [Ataeniobius toweri]|uniref:Uncharacterized protein n=1 Tax=Ataeniobius toweri TaxID=208326 RepID=A0ABU7AT38_9TELE|nr:hypothetical protein [Ataeniobius toweri]
MMWNKCTADGEGQVGTANICFSYQIEKVMIIVWEVLLYFEIICQCLLKKHRKQVCMPRPSFEGKLSLLVHGNAARSHFAKSVFIITLMRSCESYPLCRGPLWFCSHPTGKLPQLKMYKKA